MVAIVTGATSGMGRAIATKFIEHGALLVASGRDKERGEELAKEQSKYGELVFVPADLSLAEENKYLVQKAMERFGRIDILSLNAGVLGLGSVTDVSLEDWNTTLNTNLNSIFYLCRYAIPKLLEGDGGNIIINASIAAFKSFPRHAAYCASKAASVALMKQMALDYAPHIRINAICPGPVNTPLLRDSVVAFENAEGILKETEEKTLLKRLGQPQDIAELALFLASIEASWITGTAVTIDGGILNA